MKRKISTQATVHGVKIRYDSCGRKIRKRTRTRNTVKNGADKARM